MADVTATDSPPNNVSGTKKKGGLLTFIKKNKTLSGVVGGVGVYLLYKMNKEKSEGGTEPEGTVSEVAGEGGAIAGTAEAAAFELGRSERVAESSHQEVEELENEREEERTRRKEKEREHEQEEEPGGEGGGEDEPSVPGTGGGTGGGEVEPAPGGAPSVNIHGRNFPGATGSHIAKTGKTEGGKAYVEYAVQFPGKVEHWQYFTATGNWRQVAGSNTGGGANAPGPGNNPKPNPTPVGGKGTGPKKPTKPARPPIAIGPAQPVGGGGGGSGGGGGCPDGTANNIRHARDEVNRLQGEINSLQGNISAHPNAKQRGEWETNIRNKQGNRDQFQQVVNNGHSQPGCGGI
jgi:hypothetical protein